MSTSTVRDTTTPAGSPALSTTPSIPRAATSTLSSPSPTAKVPAKKGKAPTKKGKAPTSKKTASCALTKTLA